MARIWQRFGGWRRVVLTLGVFGVAIVLWERDRRVEAWRDRVAEATRGLMDGEDVSGSISPAEEFLRADARRAIEDLEPPRTLGTVEADPDGDARGMILVTGCGGGTLRFHWSGAPPILVGVDRIELETSLNLTETGVGP